MARSLPPRSASRSARRSVPDRRRAGEPFHPRDGEPWARRDRRTLSHGRGLRDSGQRLSASLSQRSSYEGRFAIWADRWRLCARTASHYIDFSTHSAKVHSCGACPPDIELVGIVLCAAAACSRSVHIKIRSLAKRSIQILPGQYLDPTRKLGSDTSTQETAARPPRGAKRARAARAHDGKAVVVLTARPLTRRATGDAPVNLRRRIQ